MIKIRNLVPNVYYQHSRDFQLIGRLYELALTMVKTNSDLLYNLPFSENSDIMFLDLLSATLGFKTLHNYNIDQLKALCSCLTEIIRNKGNILSIKKACNALLGAEGITGQIEIDDIDIKGKGLYIIVPQELSDTTLLRDLLDYTLPAGLTYNIVKSFIVRTTIDTQTKVKNDLSQEAFVAPWETSSIYDSYNLNNLIAPNALSTSGMMINSTLITQCHIDINNIEIEFEYEIISSTSSDEQSIRNIEQAEPTKIKITNVRCYFELDSSKIYLNKSNITEISVPTTLDYKTVVEIAEGAFANCENLTKISLPFVGDKAHTSTDTCQYPFGYIFGTSGYTGATATTQYYINSTSSTTNTTYYIPSSLKEVIITGSTYIPYGSFYNCSKLTSITIPNSVTSIGKFAFYGCNSLTSIAIPNSVTNIGTRAFYHCSGLNKVIVESISDFAQINFSGYDSNPLYYAKHLYLSTDTENEITEITSEHLNGCTKISSYAFYDCSSLTSITISDSVTSIDDSAFSRCSSLTSVTIPNSVTSIGGNTFYRCAALTVIIIPDSVTSIGNYAFYYCASLTIYCEATSKPSGWSSNWNPNNRPIYWYSATQPTSEGNYWHYNSSHEPEIWT